MIVALVFKGRLSLSTGYINMVPVIRHCCRRYDKICKVEPLTRSLKETDCDCMVNGRRRDHGAERAHLTLFDVGGQGSANCQVSPPALHPITANRTLRAFTQLLP